jgi:hypothetical protein
MCRADHNATNCRTKAPLFKNGRINPAAIDALRQLGNDDRRSQRGRGRGYEARDSRQQRAIANHVQGAVAADLASLFPETVVNANASSSSDSQYHRWPSPRDVPLIFDTGASTTMMPRTRFHRTVRDTTTAVTTANGDSTRATGVGEAMFPAVGDGIAPQSLVVPGLRTGLIAAGQVAKHHDIIIQKRHMFVVPRGPPPATKLIHACDTKVRGMYQLDVAQPHTVHAVACNPAVDQALHRKFSHAGANA